MVIGKWWNAKKCKISYTEIRKLNEILEPFNLKELIGSDELISRDMPTNKEVLLVSVSETEGYRMPSIAKLNLWSMKTIRVFDYTSENLNVVKSKSTKNSSMKKSQSIKEN